MAYPVNKIGPFEFSYLMGEPQGGAETMESFTRPGVNGTGYRRVGDRPPVFRMTSMVSALNLLAGAELAQTYKDSVGGNPVNFIWNDIDYSTDINLTTNYIVQVLDVTVVSLRSVLQMAGNVTAGHTAWLECEWELQMVEN